MTCIVIDKDILGWGIENHNDIKNSYQEIIKVEGKEPPLPEDTSDTDIANFCYEHNCELFTGDKKFYTDFFENKNVKTVQIKRYAFWETGNKPIFLIKIV